MNMTISKGSKGSNQSNELSGLVLAPSLHTPNGNLRTLTDSALITQTRKYVREEREVLTHLLHLFREIDRRRLFSEYKYSSLHKMLVGHFGYSDDEAYRRTSAMRLLTELPEVEAKINNGELSLSHLGLAHTFFRNEQRVEPMTKATKLEILDKISEQPIREAQKTVYAHSVMPEQLRPDKITVVSEKKIEIRFTTNHEVECKVTELKGLLAHKYPNITMSELFEFLCDMGLEQLKNKKFGKIKSRHVEVQGSQGEQQDQAHNASQGNQIDLVNHESRMDLANQVRRITPESATHMKPCGEAALESGKSISQIRREVWERDHHKCSNCGSSYALELDHVWPQAKGGQNTKENLRILCRSCNQRSAIQHYGAQKMGGFLNLKGQMRS